MKQRPKLPQKTCGTCQHFQAMNDDGGECRNQPPVAFMKLDGQLVSAFPGVRKADIWCGEWKP